MKNKLNEGDIFEFIVDQNSKAFGQILGIYKGKEFLICIFQKEYDKKTGFNELNLKRDDILLLGISLDSKFYHNHWVVVDNCKPVLDYAFFPKYNVKEDDSFIVVDFYQRQILESSIIPSKLLFRTTWSPACFEIAFKAKHNKSEWKDDFEPLLYKGS